jgi:hypothetical protein
VATGLALRGRRCVYGYRGVRPERRTGRWMAYAAHEGRQVSLGTYADPVAAAHAWDNWARAHHGPFAALNFPDEENRRRLVWRGVCARRGLGVAARVRLHGGLSSPRAARGF